MSKEFVFSITVYLTDTNAFGNVFFSKYVEWQGMAREAFFREIMPNSNYILETGTRLITKKAAIDYKHELYLYDDVEIGLKVGAVKQASSDLIFTTGERRMA